MAATLRREGEVFVLGWSDGENRFRDEAIARWNAALDEVEGTEGAKALVTTAGKFYSNGLDLGGLPRAQDDFPDYILDVLAKLGACSRCPAPPSPRQRPRLRRRRACCCSAHDFRADARDRGFFCMPEIDMKASSIPA